MFVLYLDEFGHDGAWDPTDPRFSHHPLFGLAGFALPGENCRAFDRAYLRLKLDFYRVEVKAHQTLKGLRPERFEPKSLSDRRDQRFAVAVLRALAQFGGVVFAYGREKQVSKKRDLKLYARTMHGVMQTFERFLRQKASADGRGVVVLDRRNESRDVELLAWMQSYLYSWDGGFERIIETPLLVRSDWYHGIQAADTIARAVGLTFRYKCAGDVRLKARAEILEPELLQRSKVVGRGNSVFVHLRPRAAGVVLGTES